MKDEILKYFLEIKSNIEQDLEKAVERDASQIEIDKLIDSWTEVNILIKDILKTENK
ncbi:MULTISPECIES: hypothetical protein [unclassified Arcicella]|uniref:hypothetical protein n=1 Tax=unclassified Arcicella TaxID=2644986 RepID=UPI0028615DC7|nr:MULTISPECIES: hypothetical protein [unclassified Arcicella]MDR6562803.1 hypothetical protein [Arcicella sp. BE51]MDR6812853.1 hypothetical protein [Arcicella sp. BE140]MDR6824167.1 hypothetical protein [Arcicella sp. BE139]